MIANSNLSTNGHGADNPLALVWQTTPLDTAERRQRIAALGERITNYITLICQTEVRNGTSAEAQEKAVSAFYEKLLLAERQLARVYESLRLA